jgi:hypothetical protein
MAPKNLGVHHGYSQRIKNVIGGKLKKPIMIK